MMKAKVALARKLAVVLQRSTQWGPAMRISWGPAGWATAPPCSVCPYANRRVMFRRDVSVGPPFP